MMTIRTWMLSMDWTKSIRRGIYDGYKKEKRVCMKMDACMIMGCACIGLSIETNTQGVVSG
jgi:hypothetical protein